MVRLWFVVASVCASQFEEDSTLLQSRSGYNQKYLQVGDIQSPSMRQLDEDQQPDAPKTVHTLHTRNTDLCMSYRVGDLNVDMEECHGGCNQTWYLSNTGTIKTSYTSDKCLDYNIYDGSPSDYNYGNVRVSKCHGGPNQQWYFGESDGFGVGTKLKSRRDNLCADSSPSRDHNVFVRRCAPGANQMWHVGDDNGDDNVDCMTTPMTTLRPDTTTFIRGAEPTVEMTTPMPSRRPPTSEPEGCEGCTTTFSRGVLRDVAVVVDAERVFHQADLAAAWCRQSSACVGYIHVNGATGGDASVFYIAERVAHQPTEPSNGLVVSCIMSGVVEVHRDVWVKIQLPNRDPNGNRATIPPLDPADQCTAPAEPTDHGPTAEPTVHGDDDGHQEVWQVHATIWKT